MIKIDNFAVIGGDKRQIAMAESMSSDGCNVYVVGFEKANFYNKVIKTTLDKAIEKSEYIILPLPVTKDYITLNAPFSESSIPINNELAQKLKSKKVFCAMKSKLVQISEVWNDILLYDYFEREEFTVRNAVPTAEGAIEIAIHEYLGTINGSRCLVAGFGRIGKILAKILKAMGANVTVSARKQEDLAWIESLGYKSVKTSKILQKSKYDIVFNTIPNLIFNAHTLELCAKDTIIIDLASLPGGVDFEAATRLGIKSIQALSLPGKVAPKTAGEIIKLTIYNMIEEDAK